MNDIITTILLILILLSLIIFFIVLLNPSKIEKKKNKVHFYVARDENKTLWLFLGKPIRDYNCYIAKICGSVISESYNFKDFGLNPDDFKDLKWKDGPVEVFLNLED